MAETLNDALAECVESCGGAKTIGAVLWPSKGIDAAHRQLLACLNQDRPEKLSTSEIEAIAQIARTRGYHAVMQYLAQSLGYAPPVPVDPKEALGELHRQLIEDVRRLTEKLDRVADIEAPVMMRRNRG